ncbi:MAG: M23 family metallopeptidase [Flavisolibacter sp.]|nr:M23 family metallopeptidase [Flavisolibacter sp.]
MKLFLTSILLMILSSCGVQHHFTNSREAASDTSYIYDLPYKKGTSRFLVQGYDSWFSHRGRKGLDFKMKKNSPVYAARGGVVVSVQEGFKKGGSSRRYYGKGNHVIIRHADGTQALYGHLAYNGALVNVGDTVQQGQEIARSGSTGYSALPHLHFVVWRSAPAGKRDQLPTRFRTEKGVKYLRRGRWYKAI